METYLVGGAVRDLELGIQPHEYDYVVVGATPQQMLDSGYEQVGKDFPVFLHPETKYEYALARTERKSGKGYTGFEVYAATDVTLEQDLQRRDLTINAIAKTADGKLIDPYGGLKDIHSRVLRHVSDAFVEDPLRVLRVARFAARFHQLGFTIASETMQLMEQIAVRGELADLTKERVWMEVSRTLTGPAPHIFMQVIEQVGGFEDLFAQTPVKDYHWPSLQRIGGNQLDVAKAYASWCWDWRLMRPDYLAKPLHQQLKVPNACARLADALIIAGTRLGQEFSAEALLDVFEQTDGWRRAEQLKATAHLLKLHNIIDAEQLKLFAQAYAAGRQVDAKEILAAGFKGPEVATQLKQQRLHAIAELINDYNLS